MEWTNVVRWIHLAAAAAWLGEVVALNLVLLPAFFKLEHDDRKRFLALVFPRIYGLASVLALVAVASGVALAIGTAEGEWGLFWQGRWGRSILIGGVLGIGLTIFHFTVEGRTRGQVGSGEAGPPEEVLGTVYARLRFVPPIAMGVLVVVFFLMMYAARGV